MKLFRVLALLSAVACGDSLVFPEPDGLYQVSMSYEELVDPHRKDPWEPTTQRRIMISRFTPIPRELCNRTCRVPYMSPTLATEEDAILTDFLGSIGWPAGLLGQLEMQVCCDAPPRPGRSSCYPKLLFGTGLNTTRLFYSATAQYLASAGYEVIVMDHPYETDIVEFPDGTIIYGGRVAADPNNTVPLVRAPDIRTDDASFVLDKLGINYAA